MGAGVKKNGLFHLIYLEGTPYIPVKQDCAPEDAHTQMKMTIDLKDMIITEICVAIPYEIFQKSARVAELLFRQPYRNGELPLLLV